MNCSFPYGIQTILTHFGLDHSISPAQLAWTPLAIVTITSVKENYRSQRNKYLWCCYHDLIYGYNEHQH